MSERIILDPEVLQALNQRFQCRAAAHHRSLNTIRGELNSLRSRGPEGWIGDAANQHFSEMEQHVLPGYERLIESLNEAVRVLQYTQNEFEAADREGGRYFKELVSSPPAANPTQPSVTPPLSPQQQRLRDKANLLEREEQQIQRQIEELNDPDLDKEIESLRQRRDDLLHEIDTLTHWRDRAPKGPARINREKEIERIRLEQVRPLQEQLEPLEEQREMLRKRQRELQEQADELAAQRRKLERSLPRPTQQLPQQQLPQQQQPQLQQPQNFSPQHELTPRSPRPSQGAQGTVPTGPLRFRPPQRPRQPQQPPDLRDLDRPLDVE